MNGVKYVYRMYVECIDRAIDLCLILYLLIDRAIDLCLNLHLFIDRAIDLCLNLHLFICDCFAFQAVRSDIVYLVSSAIAI